MTPSQNTSRVFFESAVMGAFATRHCVVHVLELCRRALRERLLAATLEARRKALTRASEARDLSAFL